MSKNMGRADRILRFILAVVVAILYMTGQISGVAAAVLGVLAAVFIVTSFVGTCPLYSLVGLSTAKSG